jgi:hypothetical protein
MGRKWVDRFRKGAESLSQDVAKASAIHFGKSQSESARVLLEQPTILKRTPAEGLALLL